jgi:exosortase C (VPDSG-CTERM-specific)
MLFSRPLISLAAYASHSDLNSHILLVPFITAYLIRLRRHQLPQAFVFSLCLAIIPLVAGVVSLGWATWLHPAPAAPLSENDYLALMAVAYVCFLWAGGFLFLGSRWMTAIAFPAAFLLFMVPMPNGLTNVLEKGSVLASAHAADLWFRLSGTPFLRDGVRFQLPGIGLQVAQECSGIRSSWVLFITSLVAANLFLTSPWRRAMLVGFVIPLGILRNGFRIWVIGRLCIDIGPHMIDSIIHRRGGPLFFALSLLPFFLMIVWLRHGEGRGKIRPSPSTSAMGA